MFEEKISVIAPAHNEQELIEEFITRTSNTLKKNNLKGEILIINDGSTDNTLKIIQNMQNKIKNLRVVSHKKNKGLTSAIITGIENSKCDYIVLLHSDIESYPEEDIPKLLQPLEKGYDMAVGIKEHKKKTFVKATSSIIFNWISRKLFKVSFQDLGWVKAFKKEIYYNVETLRSDWHRFFVILAANEGYKIKEVPVNFYPRKTGESHYGKFGIRRAPGGVFDMLTIKFLLSFSKKPMHIFGTLGAILMFLGFLFGLYILYILLAVGSLTGRTPSMLLTVFLILTGLQFFVIGFLAELIVSANERKNQKIS